MARTRRLIFEEYKPPETREEFLKERDEFRKIEKEDEQRRRRLRCAGYNTLMNTRYKGE